MTYDLGVFKRQRYVYPTFNAVGGNISYYTNNGIAYTVHTFLSSSTFAVFSTSTADILLVGGGAGGEGGQGNGGGGGNVTTTTNVTLNIGQYYVNIGSGGAAGGFAGSATSIVGTINSTYASTASGGVVGTSGGGVGAGGANSGGNGGPGLYNDYNGTNTAYGGGGAAIYGSPGVGGGGSASTFGTAGTPNSGGGGGSSVLVGGAGGAGGSGIVIIRYPTPNSSVIPITDPYFNYVSLLLSNQTTNITTPAGINSTAVPKIEYIAVAGGGAAGQESGGYPVNYHLGGGGGGGGVVIGTFTNVLLSSSNTFIVTVGGGGTAGGGIGQPSTITSRAAWNFTTASITAYGGGGGGVGANGNTATATTGTQGGSGGGGGGNYGGSVAGGASIQSSIVDVSRGYSGGAGGTRGATFNYAYGGGGGGAGSGGQAGGTDSGGQGGSGYTWLDGNTYAAGGDGHPAGNAGSGSGAAGAAGTGNGGTADGARVNGSPGAQPAGPAGGSGVVIFRYSGTNVIATGGVITTVSNYVYHTFTSGGTLSLIDAASTGTASVQSTVGYLLVGGGGGGGGFQAYGGTPGGGGAGGLFTGTFTITNTTNLVSITVGAGGIAGNSSAGGTGGNSTLTGNYVTKTAYGGGAGGSQGVGGDGGCGGGAGASNSGSGTATAGGNNLNGPGTAAGGYGTAGGTGSSSTPGSGGGAISSGTAGVVAGGSGLFVNTPYSSYSTTYATGGAVSTGASAASNTGGGGGSGTPGGSGGSGVAIVWEPTSNPMPTVIGAPTLVSTSGYRVYVFTSTGALVFGNSLSNTNFTDNSSYNYFLSPSGAPSQGSFNPYSKNWSTYFNGSTDYISIVNSSTYGSTGLGLGSNNFTIEGWVYFNSVASGQLIGHSGSAWKIALASGNALAYYLSSNGSTWDIANAVSIGTVAVGQWYHFALVRSGSTFTPYLNGVAGTPTTSASSLYAYITNLTIGNIDGAYFNGYLSNIRILNGSAYYTAPFTPAISPLPLVSNTLLLTCATSVWDDLSSYGWAISINGTPTNKKFSPFSNFGSYNTTLVGGSAYFNGSTDLLTVINTGTNSIPNWTYLHDGTTDYTIEGWVYPITTSSTRSLIGTSDPSSSVTGMALTISNSTLNWYMMNTSTIFACYGSTGTIKPNAWSHIACTFSSSNKTTSLYVNGFRIATTATTTSSFTATSASYPLTIGRYAVSTSSYFSGYMSNLRILKGVISDGVVTSNIPVGTTIEYLIVAGGGGGGTGNGRGGGGGGGFRTGTFVTSQLGINYVVTVGPGGAGGSSALVSGFQGSTSSIAGGGILIESAGGGGGASNNVRGTTGGSGGGGYGATYPAQSGNVPSTVPPQGYDGANGPGGTSGGGGGGGAGGAATGVNGADGAVSNIDGFGYYYSGGGAGEYANVHHYGGAGGGAGTTTGGGGTGGRNYSGVSPNGATNTGGGGCSGGNGGSGCVIVRYFGPQRATGGDIITTNISGYTVHTFLSSGVFTDSVPSYTLPVAPVVAASTATNLLLNFTNSVIVDASLNTDIYTAGDASLVSGIKKFNNMSMYFDGTTGTALVISTSSAVALGAGNFTVEMWLYPVTAYSSGNAPALLDARTSGDASGLIRFGFNGTTLGGGPQIAWRENVTSLVTATVVLNTWTHIAVVRNSGILTMYNNGTVISTASNSTNLTVPFKYIGQTYNNLPFNGYIDDLRITNGIARYTTPFVPPIYKPQLR